MPSDAQIIGSPSAYQETCMEIVQLVAEARSTGRQDAVIAELCSDPKKLAAHGHHHALMMLRGMNKITPTYVMMSKAGDGLVIPLTLDAMPEQLETRIAIVAPLAFLLRLAPIDGYILIAEIDSFVLIMSYIGEQSHKTIYTVRRRPQTGDIIALNPFTNPMIAAFDENPCLMNLYELADDILNNPEAD